MSYEGDERRKGYIQMEERLREVELQLAELNGSLPAFKEDLKNAVTKIGEHETNAAKRWNEHLDCMVKRQQATSDLSMLKWVVASIILVNAGMIVTLLVKAFAK